MFGLMNELSVRTAEPVTISVHRFLSVHSLFPAAYVRAGSQLSLSYLRCEGDRRDKKTFHTSTHVPHRAQSGVLCLQVQLKILGDRFVSLGGRLV